MGINVVIQCVCFKIGLRYEISEVDPDITCIFTLTQRSGSFFSLSVSHLPLHKEQIYHISDIFKSGSLHDVARLGSEFIGLWFICTKYNNFLMRHTNNMHPSYPTITRLLVPY